MSVSREGKSKTSDETQDKGKDKERDLEKEKDKEKEEAGGGSGGSGGSGGGGGGSKKGSTKKDAPGVPNGDSSSNVKAKEENSSDTDSEEVIYSAWGAYFPKELLATPVWDCVMGSAAAPTFFPVPTPTPQHPTTFSPHNVL